MIVNKNIPTTGSTVLQSQPGQSLAATALFFCNVDENIADSVTIFLVQAGSSASGLNIIVNNHTVPPSDTLIFEYEKLILENGDSIVAKSKSGLIVATCSYMDIT